MTCCPHPSTVARAPTRDSLAEITARGQRAGRLATPDLAGVVLEPLGLFEVQEVAVVMSLDVHSRFHSVREVARGDQEHVEVPIPFAIRAATLAGSRWSVLAHNHPSGSSRPSSADVRLWHQAARSFACAGLRLLDHLVIGRGEFYSCAWDAFYRVR